MDRPEAAPTRPLSGDEIQLAGHFALRKPLFELADDAAEVIGAAVHGRGAAPHEGLYPHQIWEGLLCGLPPDATPRDHAIVAAFVARAAEVHGLLRSPTNG